MPLIVLYVGKVEELRQFHLINDRQRRISTSLAYALLATAASGDERVARTLIPRKEWLLPATKLAIDLSERSPWIGPVKLPNDPPDPMRFATLNSLANSLQYFVSNRDRVSISQAQAVGFLERFWTGLQSLMPNAFRNP